jgi:putative heme-binding domain-containing protein
LAGDSIGRALAVRLVASFKLTTLEPELVALLQSNEGASVATGSGSTGPKTGGRTGLHLAALRALREMGSSQVDLFARLAKSSTDAALRDEAVLALASSKSEQAAPRLLELWPDLAASQRRTALDRLAGSKSGAPSLVRAVKNGTLEKADLDSTTLDKLKAVLPNDADLDALIRELSAHFRPALRLDGQDDAWVDSDITLDGPFTVEAWVKLDPGIDNNDGILGAPGAMDMNFYDAKFRVWVGGGAHDAIIAKKSMVPDWWTHVAVTRDERGSFRLYLNGEAESVDSQTAPQKFEHCRIGWTAPGKGTAGWLTEYRVWNLARTSDEIRADFDRNFEGEPLPAGLVHYFSGSAAGWGKLHGSAKVEKTADFPPLLTAAEARAQTAKFGKFRGLAEKPGDSAHGKTLFNNTCLICHSVGGQGGQIGPVLSGAGAMGTEALLRAVLTPSAAMEAGYRLFRVELKDGDVMDGLLVSQDREALLLRRPNSEDQRIAQAQIKRAAYTKLSLMPEGLLEPLKPEEVSDLFAYLKTLR